VDGWSSLLSPVNTRLLDHALIQKPTDDVVDRGRGNPEMAGDLHLAGRTTALHQLQNCPFAHSHILSISAHLLNNRIKNKKNVNFFLLKSQIGSN